MANKSFKNSKNKIQENWERSEENKNNINKVPIVALDFNSINFNKKIVTIPIITNEIYQSGGGKRHQSILLENFPEWVIPMIEVSCIYTVEDGFVNSTELITQEFSYWFEHIDKTNFLLKTIQIASATENTPFFNTISLKIINQRLYETTNQHKE